MKIPKNLRADMERGLIHAYYRYVCGADSVSLDLDIFPGAPWVAVAVKGDRVWLMDFSSRYEFPLEAKPATVIRQMTERAQAAAEDGLRCVRLAHGGPGAPAPEVIYEVWCFMSPSERVLRAHAEARARGERVVLVTPDELAERVRQTVLATGEPTDENAFTQAAAMIRRAFGLRAEER